MRFSFAALRELVASLNVPEYVAPVDEFPGFPIHPSASELAEQMLVDPEVLKNETYEPGIYDEDGDYYPQYTDDPSNLPEFFAPNDLGGDTAPESSPAESSVSSESQSNDSVQESS